MIRDEIREDDDIRFIGKTDVQILRELAASWGHQIVLRDEESGQQNIMASVVPGHDGDFDELMVAA
jgi:hypothetical protein